MDWRRRSLGGLSGLRIRRRRLRQRRRRRRRRLSVHLTREIVETSRSKGKEFCRPLCCMGNGDRNGDCNAIKPLLPFIPYGYFGSRLVVQPLLRLGSAPCHLLLHLASPPLLCLASLLLLHCHLAVQCRQIAGEPEKNYHL